jgi:elongation factor P hydroxylase
MPDHEIVACFAACLGGGYNTVLQGGGDEPLYLPARGGGPATIIYRHDYAASALHEVAHWCIAGPHRRTLKDFGYAYIAPPRGAAAQARFCALETKTQALEAIFAAAAGVEFTVSTDDLDADPAEAEFQRGEFMRDVMQIIPRTQMWVDTSHDGRARAFVEALRCHARQRAHRCNIEPQ